MDTDMVSHDDPQFVKVLDTCLTMEMAVVQEKFQGKQSATTEIKRELGVGENFRTG